MAVAIVTLLLNTALRVDELVTLTWQRIQLHARSGRIDVIGKGDKRRRLPLNVEARRALEAIQPVDYVASAVFRGKRGPYTARGIEYLVAEFGRRAQVSDVHPHRFRHDTARRLVETVDLRTVAAGHGADLQSARRGSVVARGRGAGGRINGGAPKQKRCPAVWRRRSRVCDCTARASVRSVAKQHFAQQ